MSELQVQYCSTASLHPHPRNPRTHSKKQIRQIADSIRAFGFTSPLLLDANLNVLAGHGRLQAAKLIGMDSVPTISVGGLTEAQALAYLIADNKLAEESGWDLELLALELEHITALDIDFTLELTGFSTPEIDMLLSPPSKSPPDEDPPPLPDLDSPAITQPGDLWVLGRHRILCGDSLASHTYDTLMSGEKAEMLLADPPYNVPINGHVSGLGSARHREFPMATGEMNEEQYVEFLAKFMTHATHHTVDGSLHFIFGDWRHAFEVLSAARGIYQECKNLIVWAKTNGGMGSLYRSQHELVWLFKNGTKPHVNNILLGRHGRYRSNLWTYAGFNSFRADRDEQLHAHPTPKPLALVKDAILDCSSRAGLVLDSFVGGGTTILAAEQTGRRCYAIELDPHYCDVTVKRWQAHTGQSAINAKSELPFNKIRPCNTEDSSHE